MNAKHTEPLDTATLAQFTGTAQYWRVARQFAITDGVKYLAETAACFWLIDAAISHLLEIGTADWFVLVWQVLLAPALAGYAAFNLSVFNRLVVCKLLTEYVPVNDHRLPSGLSGFYAVVPTIHLSPRQKCCHIFRWGPILFS